MQNGISYAIQVFKWKIIPTAPQIKEEECKKNAKATWSIPWHNSNIVVKYSNYSEWKKLKNYVKRHEASESWIS